MIIGGPTYNKMIFQLLHEKLGLHWSEDFRGIMLIPDQKATKNPLEQEDVVGAVGYNGFVGRVCCMHSYLPKPYEMTREFIIESFHYPFEICNCVEIMGLVNSINHAARKLNARLGFEDKIVISDGAIDGDLIIMTLKKQDCKWLSRRRA